jgi:cysteine synthase A
MHRIPLTATLVDRATRDRNLDQLRDIGAILPKFSELADPRTIPIAIRKQLEAIDPDAPHPLNLFRVHWYNSKRAFVDIPEHIVLPSSLTGVDAKIVVLFGNRFPMIHAHKVLAAYACLAPRIVTGQFDLARHRAVWPSTGNFCRGGIAISRILGTHGVAVLPAGMSAERFRWLETWAADRADIVRTPGTESNVKEIYDACAEMARDLRNVVFNQFAEMANYLVHYGCTGRAIARVVDQHGGKLRAFVAASGSAGTLAAGDYLKNRYGSATVAVEALECPTLLGNGYGEHNIQGIGDKHVPLIHNAMNTDMVVAVSDRATDALNVVFNTPEGHDLLSARRHVPDAAIAQLESLGISSICNILAAIKTAKYYRLGPDDVIATVATDGAEMYASELEKHGRFDSIDAATALGQHLLGASTDNMLELNLRDRERIFNLGYFTWVEQQGVPLEEFDARRSQGYWRNLQRLVPTWDAMIEEARSLVPAATY